MAVIIEQEPFSTFTPSGNPVVFTFSSDQTAQANFSYLVEVYVNGVIEGRQQVFPESGVYGRIDCTSFAERFTSAPSISSTFSVDAANYAEIYIKVIERYGDPIADGANATSGTTPTVFKASMSNVDFINWDSSNYVYDVGITNNKIFTTFPVGETAKCGEGEQFRLMMLADSSIEDMDIEFFDSNDVAVTGGSIPVAVAKIIIVNVGLKNLLADGTVNQATIDASAYYVINFSNTTFGADSEPFRIDIDRECNSATSKRLHFISPWGTIESFTYSLPSTTSGGVISNRFTKEFGSFNGANYEFDLSSGTNIDYRKRSNKNLLIRSNWLSEEIQQWLEYYVSMSPLSFIEDTDDVNLGLRRISISKSQFLFKTIKENTLFKEELTIVLDSHNSMTL